MSLHAGKRPSCHAVQRKWARPHPHEVAKSLRQHGGSTHRRFCTKPHNISNVPIRVHTKMAMLQSAYPPCNPRTFATKVIGRNGTETPMRISVSDAMRSTWKSRQHIVRWSPRAGQGAGA
jgi:hypothetical protein